MQDVRSHAFKSPSTEADILCSGLEGHARELSLSHWAALILLGTGLATAALQPEAPSFVASAAAQESRLASLEERDRYERHW